MLTQELIEKALILTGNTIGDMVCDYWTGNKEYATLTEGFSFEKFCYHLLSPGFLFQFELCTLKDVEGGYILGELECSKRFGQAIYYYQKGDNQPLIDLLSVI